MVDSVRSSKSVLKVVSGSESNSKSLRANFKNISSGLKVSDTVVQRDVAAVRGESLGRESNAVSKTLGDLNDAVS